MRSIVRMLMNRVSFGTLIRSNSERNDFMKNIRKPLNCAVDGNEQAAVKAQLKDWCTKFFEKNNIYRTKILQHGK